MNYKKILKITTIILFLLSSFYFFNLPNYAKPDNELMLDKNDFLYNYINKNINNYFSMNFILPNYLYWSERNEINDGANSVSLNEKVISYSCGWCNLNSEGFDLERDLKYMQPIDKYISKKYLLQHLRNDGKINKEIIKEGFLINSNKNFKSIKRYIKKKQFNDLKFTNENKSYKYSYKITKNDENVFIYGNDILILKHDKELNFIIIYSSSHGLFVISSENDNVYHYKL